MITRRRLGSFLLCFLAVLFTQMDWAGAAETGDATETATLNGLEIVLDRSTGSILRLSHPAPGVMLDATAETASILDLACPVPEFEPLRLASRFSREAKITRHANRVVVHWDRLGASRPLVTLEGTVAATVTFEAAPDGQSVILSCTLDNRSEHAIRQVLFPDFMGLVPFAGLASTEFRLCGSARSPFVELARPQSDQFFARSSTVIQFTSGGLPSPMIGRWMDLGGLKGGLSLFPRQWGADPRTTVMLQMCEATGKLRWMMPHTVTIAPKGTWESPKYWLTAHQSGWAKGIEPYRAWAKENTERICAVPDRVRDGLGFRTVWMCRTQPNDPQDAVFTFRDLPRLAQESKDHGLDEMVLWFSHPAFELPLPPFFEHLGGEKELLRAVAQCKKLGVNVAPFISVLQAGSRTAARYGLKTTGSRGWTYHPELIPRFNPGYAVGYSSVTVGSRNPLWQKEVLAACRRLVDIGFPSISWDQFYIEPPEPNLLTLTREIRRYARDRDPQSTFSAEELHNFEVSCDYLDYTWNWGMYRDLQPLTHVFPAPRVNLNVDGSAADVKYAFAYNRYVNVQPRRPDDINGSDLIQNHPDLSRALRQCARLRARFLPYFVDGTLVGDCILSEKCTNALVCGYVLPNKVLIVVVNTAGRREINLACDLAPWLPSPTGQYQAALYGADGELKRAVPLSSARTVLTTALLDNLDIAILELTPK